MMMTAPIMMKTITDGESDLSPKGSSVPTGRCLSPKPDKRDAASGGTVVSWRCPRQETKRDGITPILAERPRRGTLTDNDSPAATVREHAPARSRTTRTRGSPSPPPPPPAA